MAATREDSIFSEMEGERNSRSIELDQEYAVSKEMLQFVGTKDYVCHENLENADCVRNSESMWPDDDITNDDDFIFGNQQYETKNNPWNY